LASPFGGRQLITRKVAAALLGVDPKTLTLMREQRLIPGVLTASGEYRFSESDIRAYLAMAQPGWTAP
jgi:predicted site-specific integrase-resolvase